MSINFILSTLKNKFITCIPLQIPRIGILFLIAYLMRLNSILSLVFEILSFEKTLLPPGKMINLIFFLKN